jgi:H+/Cl- antiporter ClcA
LKNGSHFIAVALKWLVICLLVGILAGASSALFLYTLNWATAFRGNHLWLIFLLPLAGLSIGLLYHHYGSEVVKGNNLILEEYEQPQNTIPLRMAPFVYIGTMLPLQTNLQVFLNYQQKNEKLCLLSGLVADLPLFLEHR